MDQVNNSVPFDPDFDSGSNSTSADIAQPKQGADSGSDESGINPFMAFYAGMACGIVVFGLAGIITLLTLIN